MEHPPLLVRQNPETGQNSLVTQQAYLAGDQICRFGARETLDHATYLTVQTGTDRHILLNPEYLQYCNHSCAPNIFFDTATMEVIALQDIAAGEELTFFYPSTEWEMAQPFACYCGSTQCLGTIRGAAALPEDILKRYRLTDFIQRQLQQIPLATQSA